VNLHRAQSTPRDGLLIQDAQPLADAGNALGIAAQAATIGIFIILFGIGLYLSRPVLMPTTAALVVGLTLEPVVARFERYGVPAWASALGLVVVLLIAGAFTATLISAPVTEWIERTPEIGAIVKQKLSILVAPLNALRELQDVIVPSSGVTLASPPQLNMVTPVLAFVTPAVAELVIFFVALLFFLAGHTEIRQLPLAVVADRGARLRTIRIIKDSQHNLASYLATVAMINFGLGAIVAVGAWLLGMPNPVLFGLLAAVLNYIPYIGPACVVAILFGVGIVSFDYVGYALVPPACFVALTTVEGQIVTPAILGTRLPLRPLAIFLSLAFWAWLWGPIGAFLAVPLAIIGRVIVMHLIETKEPNLPD
jgi:predicted PurR-regulated permease PerM